MKKLILLLSLALSACVTRFEPEDKYLPPAQVGQPYHQRIYLYGSIPKTIWIDILPENNGLHYRFLDTHSDTESATNSGNIFEISGIPNDNDDLKIIVAMRGYNYKGRQNNKRSFKKLYVIKLIPDKNRPPKPAKTASPPPDNRPPGCIVTYDEIKKDLGCLDLADWDKQ